MKIKKSVFALILAVAIAASFAAGTAAAGTTAKVTATLDYGATVELHGVPQSFLDSNGNRIYLINYNGSMYLPIRKVAELVDLDVDWDGATHTVKLGNTKDVRLIDDIEPYYVSSNNYYNSGTYHKTSEGETQTISGINVSNYLKLHVSGGGGNYRCDVGAKVRSSFNLAGKYESVTFKYYCTQDAILRVYYDDDTLQKEIKVSAGAVAREVTLPLFGTSELTFETEKTTGGADTDMYIFDATVKPIQK